MLKNKSESHRERKDTEKLLARLHFSYKKLIFGIMS
jgi:hypothetical protein